MGGAGCLRCSSVGGQRMMCIRFCGIPERASVIVLVRRQEGFGGHSEPSIETTK